MYTYIILYVPIFYTISPYHVYQNMLLNIIQNILCARIIIFITVDLW